MPVSYAQLKAMLDVDEPDYPALAAIAAGAMNHLRKLAASPDVAVASKAVSLAGIIGDDSSVDVIADASRSRDASVRVAAAYAASLLPATPHAARVVNKLLDDGDVGVVKIAARAASRQSDPAVARKALRAKSRMATMARAATKQHAQRERTAAMTKKTGPKAGNRAKTAKRTAGSMPAGAMSGPPKGAKARSMPTGKMK